MMEKNYVLIAILAGGLNSGRQNLNTFLNLGWKENSAAIEREREIERERDSEKFKMLLSSQIYFLSMLG